MAQTSYDLLAETRSSIEDTLAKMLLVKKSGKPKTELRELITEASVMFMNLRQINRIILQEEDRVKSETESAKNPLDQTTLRLHNLLYEKNHYLKAIKACKDFKSKYPDIELVPEDEFFRSAPEDFKTDLVQNDPHKTDLVQNDPHKIMMQRLSYEMYQRKELYKQRELLEARKKSLQESIVNRKKFLSSLPSHLKSLRKASLPVQNHLGISYTKRMKQHLLADLLPPPLYILYSQLLSQKEAFGEAIDVEVSGSAKDAQAVLRQQALKETGTTIVEEGKVDEDAGEDDDDSQRRRKRARKAQQKEVIQATQAFQTHPLAVVLQIYDDECSGGEKVAKLLSLKFEYIQKLNVVCVGLDTTADAERNLLANLFPDDTGVELPSQAAKLIVECENLQWESQTSYCYKWAQHLAGIDILPEKPPVMQEPLCSKINEVSKTVSISSGLAMYRQEHRVQTVLQQLRARKKAQLALREQLECLRKLSLPSLKFTTVPWASHTPKCHLSSWSEVERFENLVAVNGAESGSGGGLLEMETGREDGELPSALATSILAPERNIEGDKKTIQPDNEILALEETKLKQSSIDLGNSMNVGKLGLRRLSASDSSLSRGQAYTAILEVPSPSLDVDSPLGDAMEISGVMEEPEQMSMTSDNPYCRPNWKSYADRSFKAIFKREDGGRNFELEAQIKIRIDYPVGAPFFNLCLLSGGGAPPLPPAPPGVLDVAESPVPGVHNFEWFNELRAMESKVNVDVLSRLPKWEENYVLSHQITLVSMLFDLYIDYEICGQSSVQKLSDGYFGMLRSSFGTLMPRALRGRDRRKVFWSDEGSL